MAKKMKEGPYVESEKARKMPGKTVKVGGTKILKKKGKKDIAYKVGGLHASLGVKQGKKIPAKKRKEAKEGKYGKLAAKQERFAENVLTGRKKK